MVQPGSVATELDIGEEAVNAASLTKRLELARLLEIVRNSRWTSQKLATNARVAVTEIPESECLTGQFIDAEEHLGEMLVSVKPSESRMVADK